MKELTGKMAVDPIPAKWLRGKAHFIADKIEYKSISLTTPLGAKLGANARAESVTLLVISSDKRLAI